MIEQIEPLVKIERALLSVSDKNQLLELAGELNRYGVEIIATGGTGKFLREHDIPFKPIDEITGNPESFDGRMKSISFQIASGLLYRRDIQSDIKDAKNLGIPKIDLVVCNLYPFQQSLELALTDDEQVEYIDVGGPTMIRAGAKNYKWVSVCLSPDQYRKLLSQMNTYSGCTSLAFRKELAAQAFMFLSSYDGVVAQELYKKVGGNLRYGENPHQKAHLLSFRSHTLADTHPLCGKAMSYNNYLDSDSALKCVAELGFAFPDKSCVVIVKHQNPCGAAVADNNSIALEQAWAGDPVSSFGSIIAFSKVVTENEALWLRERFVEVILAPGYDQSAKEILMNKKNLRLLELDPGNLRSELVVRSIHGGMLVQSEDDLVFDKLECVTNKNYEIDRRLVTFGVVVTKYLKSNAISLVRLVDGVYQMIGVGSGNPNRVISVRQCVEKARENGVVDFSKCILISDAFFPFRDNVDMLAGAGIGCVVQPGGSVNDKQIIAACNENNIAMYFSGIRHFRH